ncbi:WD40 repeat domain-containing protein [Sulfurimonas sp.]|uniref:WD40 repeat domain-containing protein n=1 Tax=Sulfurimonas sp. TaxID=2022749 RepID=UPI002B48E611|nr:WD40 repeat domain-containing protein [Sulfurimonas sp.]
MISIYIKYFILICFIYIQIDAKDIFPTFKLKSVGFVNDFVIDKNHLYAANDMGVVDIFDIKKKQIVKQIVLPPLTTSMNKLIAPNILSVDYINNKVLIVSIGKSSYTNVWIYENNELKNIINEEKKLSIKEARFLDDKKIIFGTLGSEVILRDTTENYNVYKIHISYSALGDMTLSDDKQEIIVVDEGGEVKLIDAKSSKVKKSFKAQNVDNIFHVAFKNGVVLTAGQDRRMAVYVKNQKPYYIKNDFLVYCVGLSPSAKVGVFSRGEENYLQLFNPKTKEFTDRLVGHKAPPNNIIFINEKELFSSDARREIFYWRID